MRLEVKDLEVNYQNIAALKGISFTVPNGAFITIIGSNGAGKSTTLRTISGLVKPSSGTISVDGERIDGLAADKIVALGISHVPEGRRIFKDLTVVENLHLGAFIYKDQDRIDRDLNEVYSHFPRLLERSNQQARTLSGGEQQMLSIGRALMSRPKVLLLDEPSLGLAPLVVQEIGEILQQINQAGVTVILVEQNADLALRLVNYGHVLENGRITMSDKAGNLANNDHVRRAYLGV
ncbi:MAG: ABC transporter ATP-binding protein [Acidiferrobacterales bacterium]|nr:ABC transporter ATP-binding protein [Acidiferrobacterales bacterium]